MGGNASRTSARAVLSRLRRSRLARSSGVYMLSNVLNRSVPFFLLPVLTRYLTPEDYGIAAMFALGVSLAIPLVGMNTESAIGRQYYERERIDFRAYVTGCFQILAVTTAILTVAVFLFREAIAAGLALPTGWLWSILVVAVARYVTRVTLTLWQVQQRPKPYGVFFFAQTGLSLGVAVVLIVGFQFDWRGRVLGEVVGVAGMAMVGLVVLARTKRFGPHADPVHRRHALKFGGGLVPHSYGGILIGSTDRILVTHLVGVGATGLYVVGAQVAMIIEVLEHSFNQAWIPWLFERLKRRDPAELRQIARFRRLYNIGILTLALALAAVAPWFLRFFVGPEFVGASIFVFWLALGNAFGGMYKMVVNEIFYAQKTHLLAAVTIITGVVNVLLSYVLITRNGTVGAAQATAAAFFLSYVLTARLSKRVMREC